MPFKVFLTDDAVRDLEQVYDYIEHHDAPSRAEYVLGKIEKAFLSLSENPNRGAYPRELSALGIKEYREVFFKPYRIIYRVEGRRAYVLMIVDGRRDMQTLLERRLLQAIPK
jgi:toxin ParE1/3/4